MTVVIISIGGLLSWLVSSSSSVPELTCQGVWKGCLSQSLGGGEGTAKARYGQLRPTLPEESIKKSKVHLSSAYYQEPERKKIYRKKKEKKNIYDRNLGLLVCKDNFCFCYNKGPICD